MSTYVAMRSPDRQTSSVLTKALRLALEYAGTRVQAHVCIYTCLGMYTCYRPMYMH